MPPTDLVIARESGSKVINKQLQENGKDLASLDNTNNIRRIKDGRTS
jgi:hypothetical protein